MPGRSLAPALAIVWMPGGIIRSPMVPAIDSSLNLPLLTVMIIISHSRGTQIASQHLPALGSSAALRVLPDGDESQDQPPDLAATVVPVLENHNYPSFLQC
jgi:hypothetical protein